MQTRIECPVCLSTTYADARQLEPAPVQTEPGVVEFIVYCNNCGRAQLARESRARWEAETGRVAPPVGPAAEGGGGRQQ
jgi:hypothetical protein